MEIMNDDMGLNPDELGRLTQKRHLKEHLTNPLLMPAYSIAMIFLVSNYVVQFSTPVSSSGQIKISLMSIIAGVISGTTLCPTLSPDSRHNTEEAEAGRNDRRTESDAVVFISMLIRRIAVGVVAKVHDTAPCDALWP